MDVALVQTQEMCMEFMLFSESIKPDTCQFKDCIAGNCQKCLNNFTKTGRSVELRNLHLKMLLRSILLINDKNTKCDLLLFQIL
jgi:hypothetical protein